MTKPSLKAAVLVVDDEVRSQEAMRRTLDEEFTIHTASDAAEARTCLENYTISVVLCDQRMPGQSGVDFLKEVRERWPDVVRIVISGYTDSQDIVAGINEAGIYQYILKPWVPDHLLASVRNAVEALALQRDTDRLHLELRTSTPVLRQRAAGKLTKAKATFNFDRIERAPDSPLNAACDMAQRVARYDLSLLVLGESGTGKELLARAVHYASPRASGTFAVENCAAMPDALLESELFGHKRGAFTGAYEDHQGLFQRANGGTVFLDEIGETSPAFQVRLLRVLQEREVRPVGSVHSVPVDVRVIAATHRDLEQRVREGLFREDLYYRLAGITITLPPLRERVGDIEPIARRLVQEVGLELGRPHMRLSAAALDVLKQYRWPGNTRELRNEIARAIALSEGDSLEPTGFSSRVLLAHLQGAHATVAHGPAQNLPHSGTLAERLDSIEVMVLRETLARHRGNKSRAAAELGLSRVGLRGKMQRFGLEDKA
ncbi:sigma-54 dependent transcriptional regulator [Rhodoferax sp. GW822-FHT02A01]|uniref:sigma-54-dependent transcriptional regulator n=1 Tax=Rhodoferax sp. GW822-FHT02A01 TaxID=3141537 RepID=UPI00315DBE1E